MSVGRTRSVITPYVGPASSAFTIRNVVAPVISSPAHSACWTGAAPRQAGSTEKCRLTQPCSGMSSADCGSSAPYATTGQQSGAQLAQRRLEVGVARVLGLEDGDPELLRAYGDRGRHQLPAAAGRVRRGG